MYYKYLYNKKYKVYNNKYNEFNFKHFCCKSWLDVNQFNKQVRVSGL